MHTAKVHFSAALLLFLILVLVGSPSAHAQPVNATSLYAQNVTVTKLVDESNYKESLFVITTSDNTYHIIVQANIAEVGNETLIDLNATLYNPANETIMASVRTPDTLTDAPYYSGPVQAFRLSLNQSQVAALKFGLAAVMVAAIIFQAYSIIEEWIAHPFLQALDTLFFGGPFIYASLPWVLYTILSKAIALNQYVNGLVDLYFPYLPLSVHVNLILQNIYYIRSDFYWWLISEKTVTFLGIVLFTYYDAQIVKIVSPIVGPSPPPPPVALPPIAQFLWNPEKPYVGETVNFTSTSYALLGATIEKYLWNLGNGVTENTASFNYIFTKIGEYNVTLQVNDSNNLSGFVSHDVTVQSASAALRVLPVDLEASVQKGQRANAELLVGETLNQTDLTDVNFRASDLTNYFNNWTISSGNITFSRNAIRVTKGTYTNVTVTFSAPSGSPIGWYLGNISVTSANGGNETIFTDLFVYGPPTANFTWTPLTPKVGEVISFNASLSMPGGHLIVDYKWNFGDGNITTTSTPVVAHVYALPGTYNVTLTVTDNESLTGSAWHTVTVTPATVTITFSQTGVGTAFLGTVLKVDSVSYNVTQLPQTYTWTIGSTHTFAFQSPLAVTPNAKQYVWTSTTGLSSSQSGSINVTTSGSIVANYKIQYLQTFSSTGLAGDATGSLVSWSVAGGSASGANPIGVAGGTVWVDSGATVSYTFVSPVTSSVSGKQYRLSTVSGPASGYAVSGANTITGNYVTPTPPPTTIPVGGYSFPLGGHDSPISLPLYFVIVIMFSMIFISTKRKLRKTPE